MTHWIIAPVILPALLAPFLELALRHDLALQRVFSLSGSVALLAIALGLLAQASGGGIAVYDLGDWPAPFGIVLVLDRLSAMMLTLVAFLGLAVTMFAVATGWDARGAHFHSLLQFQLMGLCGAFLTGDAFNLFVFFEVLLIASYGLAVHGGGALRLGAGLRYVVFNLAGSALFLVALGTLYGVTGTLNMADLGLRAAQMPAGDVALLRVGAVLVMLVFALKAALVPLHLWLTDTYAEAPGPVAALFAVMTKLGAYALLRFGTLVFPDAVPAIGPVLEAALLASGLATLAVGALGTLGARDLGRLIGWATIGSMGTLILAFAPFTAAGIAAGLFYMAQATLAGAVLFLTADLLRDARGGTLVLTAQPLMQGGLLGGILFAGALAMTGLPPLPGFLGKLLILQAARSGPLPGVVWTLILAGTLAMVVAFARAGSTLIWKSEPASTAAPQAPGWALAAIGLLFAGLVALTLGAGPVAGFLEATAVQVLDPPAYRRAVLGEAVP